MNEHSEEKWCHCGCPEKWASDSDFPVEFDSRYNEYNLIHGEKRRTHRMLYCFWCGGRLPLSKRDAFFMTPNEAEIKSAQTLLIGAKSALDVFMILGQPDATFDREENAIQDPYKYDLQKWTRAYRYSKRWKTIDFTVFEYPDGFVKYGFTGKFISRHD